MNRYRVEECRARFEFRSVFHIIHTDTNECMASCTTREKADTVCEALNIVRDSMRIRK